MTNYFKNILAKMLLLKQEASQQEESDSVGRLRLTKVVNCHPVHFTDSAEAYILVHGITVTIS